MKKLTIQDATKDELIQYFFTCDYFGGGYRIQADKEKFLIWLRQKRRGELLDAQDKSAETLEKALYEYIDYVKQANDTKDLNKKLELFTKSNEAYERYEKASKQYDKLGKKIDESFKL